MDRKILSVVIPVHNGLPYLPQTLDSILSQDISTLEIIIRDNYSNDGTWEWLNTLSHPSLKILRSVELEPATTSWSAACLEATCEFTKIVCADDLLTPGALKRQLQAIQSDPRISLVASRRGVIDSAGNVAVKKIGLAKLIGRFSGKSAVRFSALTGTNLFGEPASVMFRTVALRSSLPFNAKYAYLTDLDMYRKVLGKGDFLGLESVDSYFRVSPGSWSQQLLSKQRSEFIEWVNDISDLKEFRFGRLLKFRIYIFVWVKSTARYIVTMLLNKRVARISKSSSNTFS